LGEPRKITRIGRSTREDTDTAREADDDTVARGVAQGRTRRRVVLVESSTLSTPSTFAARLPCLSIALGLAQSRR
jgi:hypothetical protein